MAAYIEYNFYITTYGGTAIAATDFNALALRATRMIDYLTFSRAKDVIDADTDTDMIESIKLATCSVADQMLKNENESQNVHSERVGSYAVTYSRDPYTLTSDEVKLLQAAKLYLIRSGLLYRGFKIGEYAGVVDED